MRNKLRDAIRTLTVAILLGVGLGAISFQVAGATVPPGDEVPVGIDSQVDSLFSLDPFVVQILLGSLIPFLISFVTNQNIKAVFKKFLLAALAAIAGMITTATTSEGGDAILSVSSLKAAAISFLTAAGVYTMIVRNSPTEAKLNDVGPDIGPRGEP